MTIEAEETELDANAVRLANHSIDDSPSTRISGRGGPMLDFVVLRPSSSQAAQSASSASDGKWTFLGLWIFICFVSTFDTYLTVHFQEHLPYLEQNPVGMMLLNVANWDPSLLIGAKFMGSTLVLGFVTALFMHNRRIGLTVTAGVAVFQFVLLGYLILM